MSGLWGLGQPRPWCSQGAASHGLGTASRSQGAASHSLATARARPVATRVQPVGVVAWHDRSRLGRARPQLAGGKTKYKNVECNRKTQNVM
jgi:hypothetical protein